MNLTDEIRWPQKTREVNDNFMDSTRWDDFKFRDGDIVIGTWAKAGTQRSRLRLSYWAFAFIRSPREVEVLRERLVAVLRENLSALILLPFSRVCG